MIFEPAAFTKGKRRLSFAARQDIVSEGE